MLRNINTSINKVVYIYLYIPATNPDIIANFSARSLRFLNDKKRTIGCEEPILLIRKTIARECFLQLFAWKSREHLVGNLNKRIVQRSFPGKGCQSLVTP